jgi:predicted nucleotidyltransferase
MLETLLENIAKALNVYEIPYMIIGGQAVLLYGEPRLTKDIDITLGVDTEALEKLERIAKSLELKILVKDIEDFVKQTLVLPTLDEKSGFRIDFIFSSSPYERDAIKRAKSVKIGKTMVKFASLEDLIIHKIIAGRPRDIEDVKTVLLKSSNFDKEYISKQLKEFGQLQCEDFLKRFEEILNDVK